MAGSLYADPDRLHQVVANLLANVARHCRAGDSVTVAVGRAGTWAALTVAFEFVFFHFIGGHSWSELLANYNVGQGRVWVFVVLWIAVAPWFFFRLHTPA